MRTTRPSLSVAIVLSMGSAFHGCASFMHGPSQDVAITSVPQGATIAIEETRGRLHDTLTTPVTAKLSRKREYLLTVRKEGYEPAAYILKRSTSGWYFANVAFWSVPGFIVDHLNGSRFNLYPQSVQVVLTESPGPYLPQGEGAIPIDAARYMRQPPPAPWSDNARLKLAISIPEGNWFYYDSPDRRISRFGFLGLTLGAEYYPKQRQFYSFNIGVITDFMVPFPAAVAEPDFHTEGTVQFQLHRELGKYVAGTGIHWRVTGSTLKDTVWGEPPVIEEQEFTFQAIGPSVSVQRRLSNNWYIALQFLPSILQRENGRMSWKYSHTAYFSIAYKKTLARM